MAARKILQLEGAELTKAELNTLLKQLSDRIIALEDNSITSEDLPSPSGMTVLSSQVNDASSSGTGETEAHSFTLDGNTLASDGDYLLIHGSGTFTANANTKTVKFYFGATGHTLAANAASSASYFKYEVMVTRRTSSIALISAWISYQNTVLGQPTRTSITSVDFTSAIVIKSALQFATTGTATEEQFQVSLIHAA